MLYNFTLLLLPLEQLGHSDLILKKLVKGHFELLYATTMLKQTNLATKFCKIRSDSDDFRSQQ